jgi:hypothetical protein
MKRRIVFFLAFLACALTSAAEKHRGTFTITSQLADGWIVEYTPETPASSTVRIDGKPHLLFHTLAAMDASSSHAGEPMLPVDVLTLGVPPQMVLQAELIDPVYETIENQLVAPYPTYSFTDGKEPVAEYRKSPAEYSRNTFFPARHVAVDPPTLLRYQEIANVRISPYQYNPLTKTIRRLVRATLQVRVKTPNGLSAVLPPARTLSTDPHFESVYKETILNYDQAKAWRIGRNEKRQGASLQDPTRDWFETGKHYYRIPIADNGWYKVTKAQLVAAGAIGSQIHVPTLKMFERGVQIPIVVRPDTSIEFYGRRNHGDSTYTDFFTDTTTYWLTWGGTAGLRFTPSFVDSVGSVQHLQSARTTKHFEENNYYYQGTGIEVIQPETVTGEGWAWGNFTEWFFPGSTRRYACPLENVEITAGLQATVRVRLVSTTPNSATPNHRARFSINDSLIGEMTFAGRTIAVYSASVPISLFRSGMNELKIESLQTLASPNQFYLDWFEVDYSRVLRAGDQQLAFTSPSPGGPGRYLFAASGYTSPQIEAYDLTTKRQLTNVRISNVGPEYSIDFLDSLASPHSYVVIQQGAARPVPSVSVKSFTDIRVNPRGADYIIISHRDFLPFAEQLAAQRQAVNGVRTRVIDVQDIYDEFNYGIMNATKLKTFLLYTYQYWTLPKPAYVVLFGNACWDYHRFLASTIHSNFVPSYGVPVSDNWFVSFTPDSVALPSMFIGRIPVTDQSEAQSVMSKIIGYDSYVLSEWNKSFMLITGGNDPGEQGTFNFYTDEIISSKIEAFPVGGTAYRIYKATPSVVDGEHLQRMKALVRQGLVFINFMGHSGGRVWGVDIGPPGELENTDGKLPFVSSVSCNVGAFADPTSNVLAREFVVVDNRGAIASWASSTTGIAEYGRDLVRDFLQGVRDSLRTFGQLTTIAKIKMLRNYNFGYIAVSTVYTNNLLGDPLARLAIPMKPDLAVRAENITFNNPAPTVNDTLVLVKAKLLNFGLMTTDSVGVTVQDVFGGQPTDLLTNKMLSPMRQIDSITVAWRGMERVGLHTLVVSLDPLNRIPEVTELNNIASKDQYVYANALAVVKPIRNMVVSPGAQRLVVSNPIGLDSTGFTYEFQLDTVDTFDSPGLVNSGPIMPLPVSGEWLTPSLPGDRIYFWRARSVYPQATGTWVESSFSTSSDVPVLPKVRWRENSAKQFRRDILTSAQATDSGVTIARFPPTDLYLRSCGPYYWSYYTEYYSVIIINQTKITGDWNRLGSSFMVIRVNDYSGEYEFRAFNLATFPPDSGLREAQRMADFINATPNGYYIGFSVIFDGATNVTPNLIAALRGIGCAAPDTVHYDQSWAYLGRKGYNGPGVPGLESLTFDTAVVRYRITNYYSSGKGSIATPGMFVPTSWDSFHWQQGGPPQTDTRLAFLGVRPSGAVDTLRTFPKDSSSIDLRFLNSLTSGAKYSKLQTAALLTTQDATYTPRLVDWWMDVVAPADLAISARTIAGASPSTTRNIEVTVHNIGFQDSDSATVVLAVFDRQNRERSVTSAHVDPVPLGNSRTLTVPIATTNLPRRALLQARVVPAKKTKDLVAENNVAYYAFDVNGGAGVTDLQVYANGVQVMDGDYVPASPVLSLSIPVTNDEQLARVQVQMSVDNSLVETWASTSAVPANHERPTFTPQLADGAHRLRFVVAKVNAFGDVDSVAQSLDIRVSRESRILQVYNYPNPFSRDTYFTMMVTGSTPPQELRIRIFTIAGRKIREIAVPGSNLRVGFNRIYWDGRDEDGDEVANGYYLYQISLKAEGSTQSDIQKLVKIR